MNLPRFGLFGIVVLLLAAGLNIAALYTAERRFAELRAAGDWVRHTQDAANVIARIYRRAVDAETGQRGFLLTQEATYLNPYVEARAEIPKDLEALSKLTSDNPVQVAQFATVKKLIDARFAQMEQSLKLKRDGDDEAFRQLLTSPDGMVTMSSLRLALDGMATEEQTQNERRILALTENQNQLRRGFYLVAGLNLFLVTLGGIFLSQDAQRRRREAAEAERRNVALGHAVNERTAELSGLSHHLQRLQEDEKAKVAREIHDELGGTLAAAKIDLQLISDKLPKDDIHRTRLLRIMSAIDDTIQVKRRIIEDLRPTLLDNLGIAAALKWQCSQFSKRWNIPCRVEVQDDALRLSPAYSIAFYRVVQEALTNITKYAQAKNVSVSLLRAGERWTLRIADDGVGIDTSRPHNSTAHGLVSMRERARALGGEFSARGQSGRGTVVEVIVPLEKEQKEQVT
jgi:signal transduction histidine kinase